MPSPSKSLPSDGPDTMERTGNLSYDHDVDRHSGVSTAQILASLPNPIFVLDADNCFTYLNQAAEMFFQSSQMILFGTPLEGFIPADSSLFSMLRRARDQHVSVGDQGLELAGPKLGLKLVNVQISPFGDTPRLLLSIQERALAERLRGQSLFRRDLSRQWRLCWRMRLKTRLLALKVLLSCWSLALVMTTVY